MTHSTTAFTNTISPIAGLKACLGIDVSKASLEVCLLLERASLLHYRRRFSNTRSGIKGLLKWLADLCADEPVFAVMESTGSYGELAAYLLHDAGHRVSVVNARRLQCYAQSRCRHNKTDQVDAQVIAQFGFTTPLPQWLPPALPQRQLQALLRRGDELAERLQAEMNRMESAAAGGPGAHPQLLKSFRCHARWLREELARIEQTIIELIQSHADLAQDCARLEAITGIGPKTARRLAAELPRHLKNSRTAAAWAGVAPRLFESGTIRKASRIGPGGNRRLRKALFFAAVSARRFNPRFKTFADRLAERGLCKMAVTMAVLHKLLRTAFAILKSKSAYDPSHQSIIPKTSKIPA
jgi:transposase